MRNLLGITRLSGLLAATLLATSAVFAQGQAPGTSPLLNWKQDSQGLSPNAALALHRIRNASPSYQRPAPRMFHQSPTTVSNRNLVQPTTRTNYRLSYYAIPAIGYAAPPPVTSPQEPAFQSKPFSQVRPRPNAVSRYWPLLMEAREDPNTGLIIWQLP